jgi:aerobic-type carbon monoxide dehydrogenase small subunit (CoxS/CutS family)
VIVDGEAVRSCSLAMKDVAGRQVLTIEGLSREGTLHPLQQAFLEHNAFQCGFCTSGMLMNAYALLLEQPQATRAEIIAGMNDNLCRCGAHRRILAAIEAVAGAGTGRAR